jgi:hypothetical protein
MKYDVKLYDEGGNLIYEAKDLEAGQASEAAEELVEDYERQTDNYFVADCGGCYTAITKNRSGKFQGFNVTGERKPVYSARGVGKNDV